MRVIGLSGGIGSGKSAVAQMLRGRGVPVIDADVLARDVTLPGRPAYEDIARAWPEVLAADGSIDRKQLAAIVFADTESRKRLEAITHPRIRAEVAAQTSALAADGHQLAFLEAALLVETGLYKSLDGLVVVTADDETRIARVMRRDGASRDKVLARMAAQLPLADKIRVADHVIDNGHGLDATAEQAWRVLQQLSTGTAPPKR
jgi:dephospho-CoA kinase